MRKKLWCPERSELIYTDRVPSKTFWDEKWDYHLAKTFASPPRAFRIIKATKRWLRPPARILEGGCGMAQYVHALDKAGFQVVGVDFAPRVVEAVKKHWPHLDVRIGDVRQMPVPDSSFDGYWSFGVIEHWPDGFATIAEEMRRVIRQGGFLFLTFPMLSLWRRRRAQSGFYTQNSLPAKNLPNFYQYALDPFVVIKLFKSLGFELKSKGGRNAWQGLGEDIPFIGKADKFLEARFPRLRALIGFAMDELLGNYCGHSAFLVFEKVGA